jgi:hypothetical protein
MYISVCSPLLKKNSKNYRKPTRRFKTSCKRHVIDMYKIAKSFKPSTAYGGRFGEQTKVAFITIKIC